MKGILVVYVNYHEGEDPRVKTDHWRAQNSELQQSLKEMGYHVMFIYSTKESCRVEKIDFDKPFPRFVGGMDVQAHEELMEAMSNKTVSEMNKEP